MHSVKVSCRTGRMFALYLSILAMMLHLSPSENPEARHGQLAKAITLVATSEGPLFKDDTDLKKTTALLVAIAFRESSLTLNVVGDSGRSVCAMQIHNGPKSLLSDPVGCVREGYRILKESIRVDPTNPVAYYARGPRYTSEEARRISRDRMRLAHSLQSR